jgi:hypothetical protein
MADVCSGTTVNLGGAAAATLPITQILASATYYSTTGNQVNILQTGIYHIMATITARAANATDQFANVGIRINATDVKVGGMFSTVTNTTHTVTLQLIVSITSGSTVEFRTLGGSGTAFNTYPGASTQAGSLAIMKLE